jgi:hypothetical protein
VAFALPTQLCTRLLIVSALGTSGAGCFMTADESLWKRPPDVGRDGPRPEARLPDVGPRGDHAFPDRRLVDLPFGPADQTPVDHTKLDLGVLVVDLPVIEDASVKDGSPTASFGDSTELAMGFCGGSTNHNMRGWTKFQLAPLPGGAQVISAELRLFFFIHWGSQDYAVHRSATDTWSETSITWNTQPAEDPLPLATCPAFEVDNVWKTWDVTSAVKQELAGDKVLSLVVQGVNTTPPTDQENYARSKDHSDPTTRPVLRVTYAVP